MEWFLPHARNPISLIVLRWCFAAVAASTLAACADVPTERGSVLVPEIAIREEERGLEFDPAMVMSIGGSKDAPGHALHLVRAAVLLGTGDVLIATEGSQSILYFDSVGSLLRQVGRAGDGPGEFRRIRSLHVLHGDTVAAWDPVVRRITMLESNGTLLKTIGLQDVWSDARPLELYGLDNERAAVVSANYLDAAHRRANGFVRDSVRAAVIDGGGQVVAGLSSLAGHEYFVAEQTALLAPFSFFLHAAGTPIGFYVGYGRGAELLEYSFAGVPKRRLRVPIRRKQITRMELEAARARFLDRFSTSDQPAIGSMYDNAVAVDSFPAFTDLKGTSDGLLWLRLYAIDAGQRNDWLVVDPSNGTARSARLPRGMKLLDARGNLVVMLTADSLDREEVQLFRLRAATVEAGA